MNALQERAIALYDLGISILPAYGKHPGIAWHWFNHERMSLKRFFGMDPQGMLGINGRVSGNILTLDYETKDRFEDGLKDCWKYCGPTWATRSHKGGHIRYRLPFAVAGETLEWEAGNKLLEIRGHRQYAILAPSPHPDGGFYEDIYPPDCLRYVEDIPGIALTEADPDPIIPKRARLFYYNHEATIQRYASPSEATMAFICSLWQAGFQETFIESALSSSIWLNSYRVRKLESERDALLWLQLSLKEASAWLATRTTNFRTFLANALSILAEQAGRETIRPSTRLIAEYATTQRKTVSRSLPRLQDRGIIHIRRGEKKRASAQIQLKSITVTPYTQESVDSSLNVIKWGHADTFYLSVWEHVALGPSARIIFETLSRHPQKDYASIAEASGKSLATVKRAMAKLLQFELVDRTKDGYSVSDFIQWDQIARDVKGWQRFEQRRWIHQQERIANQIKKENEQ